MCDPGGLDYSQAFELNRLNAEMVKQPDTAAQQHRHKVYKVVVDRAFPLAEVADAHRRMASSQHIGKIILNTSLKTS